MDRIVVALGVSLVAGLWSGAGLRATSELRSSAPLAGGVTTLATALGVARPFDRAFAIIEATRLAYDNLPGESAETDSLRRRLLAHVESVRQRRGSPADDVPLPLPPRVWTDSILNRHVRDDELALATLETRAAALVSVGLSSLDDETLAYLGSDRSTLGLIAREHAAAFAAFAGSLRIRDGRVVVPGGDAAREPQTI